MKLVDSYIDVLRFVRAECRTIGRDNPEIDTLRSQLIGLVEMADKSAHENGFKDDVIQEARFAAVAYVDEHIMCSDWPRKAEWQGQLLQRHFFDTTSAGAEFYDRLNGLNKHGPDK